jgi:ABC-type Na+ efflux pump permease subunit
MFQLWYTGCNGSLASEQKEPSVEQKRFPVWKFLIGVFAIFWIVFAVMLFYANIPFLAVTMALSMILAMSVVVVGLAWAYQKGI